MKTIDGQIFKRLVTSGANNLYNSYPEIDALNVFPVPDGDTGLNMNLTMTSGSKEIASKNDDDIYQIAKYFSRALLMGARGNSGAITSQIFRGIAEGFKDKKIVNAVELADAFENGSKVAYSAVLKPVEGTILTVIRESSTKLSHKADDKMSIEEAIKILKDEAHASLERTPNLLPVLKEVGVVDSGGAGLCKIIDGMYEAVIGNFIERNEADFQETTTAVQTQFEDEEFGYCTEFVMRLGPDSVKKVFNKNRFTNVLSSKGNSLVVVQDEDIVKVHVHTLKPGDIFNYAQQFGEFVKLKCENMTEQHHEILFNEENKEGPHMAASELKKAPLAAPKIDENQKKKTKFSLIATSSGEGIDKLFYEIGVNQIVSGGQTMNPSTNDFLTAIEKCNSEIVYILPNNGNIILAANQARDILEGKVKVIVIPTKTIMQGAVVAMNFNPELDEDENTETMQEAISNVKSGQVTFAIKDTEVNGVHIKKDDYLAIRESKDIIASSKNKVDALFTLLDSLIDEDSSVVTILCGKDVDSKTREKVKDKFEKKYEFVDIDIRDGGQPVYSFIVGVE